jgi:beta-phosphoglucomutase-like phosphatase (HAD superfamily)
MVVEDAPVGVAAATAAGMASIGLLSTGRSPKDLAGARRIVRSLNELSPAVFRDLLSS